MIGFAHSGSEEECHAIERWRRSHGLEDQGCPDGDFRHFHSDGFIKEACVAEQSWNRQLQHERRLAHSLEFRAQQGKPSRPIRKIRLRAVFGGRKEHRNRYMSMQAECLA
jgi:hypothetical protein